MKSTSLRENPGSSPHLGFCDCATWDTALNLSGFYLPEKESGTVELGNLQGYVCSKVLCASKYLIHLNSVWYLSAGTCRTSKLKSCFHRKLKQINIWGFKAFISNDL